MEVVASDVALENAWSAVSGLSPRWALTPTRSARAARDWARSRSQNTLKRVRVGLETFSPACARAIVRRSAPVKFDWRMTLRAPPKKRPATRVAAMSVSSGAALLSRLSALPGRDRYQPGREPAREKVMLSL